MKTAYTIAALSLAAMSAITLAVPASANSAWRENDLQNRQEAQKQQIVTGRKDGGLTAGEKWQLNREQRRITSLQRRAMKNDGYVSQTEYRSIRSAQKNAARNIYAERNNAKTRGFWWRNFVR